jgi:hypothetical protein
MLRLSCSAHRLEHRWSKVTEDPREQTGFAFRDCHVIDIKQFKGLGDLFSTDESVATWAFNRRFWAWAWVGEAWPWSDTRTTNYNILTNVTITLHILSNKQTL